MRQYEAATGEVCRLHAAKQRGIAHFAHERPDIGGNRNRNVRHGHTAGPGPSHALGALAGQRAQHGQSLAHVARRLLLQLWCFGIGDADAAMLPRRQVPRRAATGQRIKGAGNKPATVIALYGPAIFNKHNGR